MREHQLIEGANILTDEIVRAKRKLREKLEQLPPDSPGIIVMPTSENLILFIHDSADGIRRLAAAMAEVAAGHPKLLCAVMFHTFDDGRDESWSVDIGSHTYTRVARSDGAVERSLIIHNSAYQHTMAPETLEKVSSAFGGI
jgi:hypothetical protein